MRWKIIEDKNIADVLIEVYGKNEEDLFANVLDAFTDTITKIDRVRKEEETSIKITGKNLQDLVLNFINQLVYLKDTSLLLFRSGKFKVTYTEQGYSLFSILTGQKITKNLPIKTDVKAVTLHKFKIQKIGKMYKVSLRMV